MKETLGRYKIIKEIGRGAMGTVYQGYDPKMDRIVALKTIRKERLAESRDVEDLVMRFQKEVRATGKLVHPNIIVIYDTGEDEETAYFAMEYIEGDNLEDLVQNGIRFPMEKIIDIIAQICDGLEYTHRQGIVHRDLKPSNIMLVKGERVKITDFGISKAVGAASSPLTQAGILLGTPSYMSPEQVTGSEIDGRADLFSLGIIFYQLLTGERPFIGDTIPALLYNIVNTDPIPPSQIDSSIPSRYDELIAKALAKNPENRYQKAKNFVEDLKRASRGEPLMESPSIEATMTVAKGVADEISPKRKRYGLLAGIGVLLFVLVVGGYYWMQGTTGPSREEGKRVAPVEPVKNFGKIVVKSDPPDARVFLDGKKLEVLTPAVIDEVEAGKQHEIRVEKRGFKPWSETVEPAADRSVTVEASLERLVGTIVVKSTPPGASVRLGDRQYEELTPTVIERVPAGEKHELQVEKEGFKPWVGTVEPKPDKSVAVVASLVRLPGAVAVRSIPPGASVFLDEVKISGSTPIAVPDVSAGDAHKITVTKKGYATGVQTVTLKPGERKEVEVVLKPLLGEILVRSDPPGARVYLNDRDIGRSTPTRLPDLSPGTYTVRLKKEGYKVWKDEVLVRASEVLDLPQVKLQQALGRLNLNVTPWADVYYMGKKLGTTPLANIPLHEGTHELVLKNPPLNIEKQVSVTIVADKVNAKTVDLMEGIKGKLKIKVIPWADVYVDGKPRGTTPLKPLELAAGEHTVLVRNKKLGAERSFRVKIKPNEVVSKEVNLLKKE